MGATNSKAQTVHIPNPSEGVHVTSTVIHRLEHAKDGQTPQQQCTCRSAVNGAKATATVPQSIASELEDTDFNSIAAKMDHILGKPISFEPEVEEEINNLRSELMQCYVSNPTKPLHCAEVAQRFQDYVFEEQTKMVAREKREQEEAEELRRLQEEQERLEQEEREREKRELEDQMEKDEQAESENDASDSSEEEAEKDGANGKEKGEGRQPAEKRNPCERNPNGEKTCDKICSGNIDDGDNNISDEEKLAAEAERQQKYKTRPRKCKTN